MYRFYSDSTPRVTVVGSYEEGVLKLATARCSSKDNFQRKTGRELAEKRLSEGKHIAKIQTRNMSTALFVDIAHVMVKHVNETKKPY